MYASKKAAFSRGKLKFRVPSKLGFSSNAGHGLDKTFKYVELLYMGKSRECLNCRVHNQKMAFLGGELKFRSKVGI